MLTLGVGGLAAVRIEGPGGWSVTVPRADFPANGETLVVMDPRDPHVRIGVIRGVRLKRARSGRRHRIGLEFPADWRITRLGAHREARA